MSYLLDESYLEWLYSQVDDPEITNPSRTHWRLVKVLFTTKFTWFIPNDDNRVEDGKELRFEFVDQSGLMDVDPGWIHLECSMLEMFMGLSRRLAFTGGGRSREWFWQILRNLKLDGYNDRRTYEDSKIQQVLTRVNERDYKPNGDGGLFPLRNPPQDQRDVEIWYQANAYLIELDSLDI